MQKFGEGISAASQKRAGVFLSCRIQTTVLKYGIGRALMGLIWERNWSELELNLPSSLLCFSGDKDLCANLPSLRSVMLKY